FGIAGLTPGACLKNTRWLTKRTFLNSQIVVSRDLSRRETGNYVHFGRSQHLPERGKLPGVANMSRYRYSPAWQGRGMVNQ
ncbi:MAG: hypothetical protein VW491_10990, partial [Gammaproteobacteria bacterium]